MHTTLSYAVLVSLMIVIFIPQVGANCSPANITLTSQTQVDNFQATHGGCDTVTGYLLISDIPNLTNIDGLSGIVSVGGHLQIQDNPVLANIDGLANLTNVGGDLRLWGGTAIQTDIDGLANLNSVGGALVISNYAALTDLDGLAGITGSVVSLTILNNAVLTDLDGLAGITGAVDYLRIENNAVLTDLDGLAGITGETGNLTIIGNSILTNLDGIAGITGAVDYLHIENNTVLTDLNGLANLTGTVGYLIIMNNDALTELDSLAGITGVVADLTITGNANLTYLDGLAGITGEIEDLTITGNATLSDLDSLSNLTSVGNLLVENNPSLGNCAGLAFLLGWPDGPPNDKVVGTITIASTNLAGCNSVPEILASVSGPTAPSSVSSSAISGQVTLTFSPSTTTDTAWPVTGYYAECLSDEFSIENDSLMDIPDESSIVSSLILSGVPFQDAAALSINVNITHPRTRHLTLTLESPSGTSVLLWDEAAGTGENLIGTFPTTLDPAESLAAFDGEDFNGEWQLTVADGVAAHIGTLNSWGITVQDRVTAAGETSPITVTGLTVSQSYSCTVSAITGLGIGPASNEVPTKELFADGFETSDIQ